MNISSANHSKYHTLLGRDLAGVRSSSVRKIPVTNSNRIPHNGVRSSEVVGVQQRKVGITVPADGPTNHDARLLRLSNNRLSDIHALMTYNGTATTTEIPRGGTIDLYA